MHFHPSFSNQFIKSNQNQTILKKISGPKKSQMTIEKSNFLALESLHISICINHGT